MGSLMYKQRPAYPALIAAACIMLIGAFAAHGLIRQIEVGNADPSSLLLVGCLSIGLSGTLVIVAFSRYQFTHLWKKPAPALAKKGKRRRPAIKSEEERAASRKRPKGIRRS